MDPHAEDNREQQPPASNGEPYQPPTRRENGEMGDGEHPAPDGAPERRSEPNWSPIPPAPANSGTQAGDYSDHTAFATAPMTGAQGYQADNNTPSPGTYPGPEQPTQNLSGYAFPAAPPYQSAVATTPKTKRSGVRVLVTTLVALLSVALLVALVGLGMYLTTSSTTTSGKSHTQAQPQATSTAPLAGRASTAPDWEAVSEAVRPATVSIQVRVGNGGDSGSGVVWDNAGHIVTNYHVISEASGADSITVVLKDGRLFHADVVGSDPTTDLAVLKLRDAPNDLVAANFGSSSELKVGQAVMAIGSPLGLDDTVTTGIISALDRPVAVKTAVPRGDSASGIAPDLPFGGNAQSEPDPVITNAIQVDASINPGNSGGPLFDDAGRVIGINSSIASMGQSEDTAGSIGLGFAIPADLVKSVTTQLIEKGKVAHGQLGVRIGTASVKVGSESRLGVEIGQVTDGSGAAKAGLRKGDAIIKIDGKDVRSARSLIGYVRRYVAGETVTLTIVRDGHSQDVSVQLGSMEAGS